MVAREALELLGEATAEAPAPVAVAHVQEGELRDAGPDVGRDEPDPHEVLAVEGAHSERACREMSLALGPLMGDRVCWPSPSLLQGSALQSPSRSSRRVPRCTYIVSMRSVRSISPMRSRSAASSPR